jgi:hypothetical protein
VDPDPFGSGTMIRSDSEPDPIFFPFVLLNLYS